MRISDWSSDVCSSDLLEAPFKGALGDSAVQELPVSRFRPFLGAAGHEQHIFLHSQVKLVLTKARDRHRNAIVAFAQLFDVVRGVSAIGRASCRESVYQTVWIRGVTVSLKKKKN